MSDEGAARLSGRRVLVTRPRERAEELCFLLEDEGAQVVALPLLELLPPQNERPLLAAAEHIHRYAWVVLASPSAAQALSEALRKAGTAERLSQLKVAVVGPSTARAARGYGFPVTLEAQKASGAGLLEALAGRVSPGMEVLLPAAEEGRTELLEGLAALGVEPTRVVAYRSAPVAPDDAAWAELARAPVDGALFGSPRTVERFFEAAGEQARALLSGAQAVAIGPTTAQALVEHGLAPAAVAEQPTAAGLLEATVRALDGLAPRA